MHREGMCKMENFTMYDRQGSKSGRRDRDVPEKWTDLRKDAVMGPRITNYIAQLEQNCSEYAYTNLVDGVGNARDWEATTETDPKLDRKSIDSKFRGKFTCVEYGHPHSSRLAFSPTLGSRFFPPTITKDSTSSSSLTMSCGMDTKNVWLYTSDARFGADVSKKCHSELNLNSNKSECGVCNDDKGCGENREFAKGQPMGGMCTRDNFLKLDGRKIETLKQDGGDAFYLKYHGDSPIQSTESQCKKAVVGGPTNTCCPPLDWFINSAYQSPAQFACYEPLYGITTSCQSNVTISVFGCNDGCGCKAQPDNRGECFCTNSAGQVDLIQVNVDHELLPGSEGGACRNWFTLMDAGIRATASKLRELVMRDKLEMCSGTDPAELEQKLPLEGPPPAEHVVDAAAPPPPCDLPPVLCAMMASGELSGGMFRL